MQVPPFRMSDATRAELKSILTLAPTEVMERLMELLPTLLTEVEVYCTVKAMENLRQQWAANLATMLRM